MPVPVLVCLCAFATFASDLTATTTVTIDDKSFAVIVPVKQKDKYISVTVVTSGSNEDLDEGYSESVWDDTPTPNEVTAVLDEKKTASAEKPEK